MKKGPAPARKAALAALIQVEQAPDVGSAQALNRAALEHRLDSRDFRLAAAIVYGVLRRALWLDLQYVQFLRKRPSELSPPLRILFRMAACQKFLLERIPLHAIADDSVELARRTLRSNPYELKFVNAVLRRMMELSRPVEPPSDHGPASMSLLYSCPQWLLEFLHAKFGSRTDEILATTFLSEAPVTLRANRLAVASREELAQLLRAQGIESEPGALAPEAIRLCDSANLTDLLSSPLFAAGTFYLQDEASQIVAHLACPAPGMRILDLCSAPGGKATHLAELTGGRANVVATDVSETRLERVRENVTRLRTPGLEIAAFAQFSASEMRNEDLFDLVLLDAPCSGLGTIRRKPEIRYRITSETLIRLARQQLDILEIAHRFVRPGGRLIYSTCTVSDEENRDVVKAFLIAHPEFSLAESESPVEAVRNLRGDDGIYRTWPSFPDVDGFEAAILQRNGL